MGGGHMGYSAARCEMSGKGVDSPLAMRGLRINDWL